MKNKLVRIGAIIGFLIGLIASLNLNNLFGQVLLYPFSVIFFGFLDLIWPCAGGNACDDRLYYLQHFFILIPFVYALCGALMGLMIKKERENDKK